VPAGALGDRLHHVVVLQLRPLRLGRHKVEHLAVAYALGVEALGGGERLTVGPAQQPAAVPLAVVRQPVAGVPQHLGQQLGQRDVLGQRHVDPPRGRADRHPREPGRAAEPPGLVNRHASPPKDGAPAVAAGTRALYLP
jgi:hypothetical protein